MALFTKVANTQQYDLELFSFGIFLPHTQKDVLSSLHTHSLIETLIDSHFNLHLH